MASATLRLESTAPEETLALGRALGEAIRAAGVEDIVVDLRGELGAGKTVLVRGVARGAGLPAALRIVSPTFTVARSHALPGPVLHELHHLDAYRLGSVEDLDACGFEDMCGTGRLTCVEWGENVEDGLPEDRLLVVLVPTPGAGPVDPERPPSGRVILFTALGPAARVVLDALRVRMGEVA